jgi:hypothetical protein
MNGRAQYQVGSKEEERKTSRRYIPAHNFGSIDNGDNLKWGTREWREVSEGVPC